MDPRFVLSALIGVFCVVVIFATVTTVRQISHQQDTATISRTR
jgi:hypothetical protein